jgi:hypothetical protein
VNGVLSQRLQVERERLLRKHSKVGATAKAASLLLTAELVSRQSSSVSLLQQQVLQQLLIAFITII